MKIPNQCVSLVPRLQPRFYLAAVSDLEVWEQAVLNTVNFLHTLVMMRVYYVI